MVEKFATGVADTGGKFATGVVDTGGNFAAGVVDTGGKFATSAKKLLAHTQHAIIQTLKFWDLCVYSEHALTFSYAC